MRNRKRIPHVDQTFYARLLFRLEDRKLLFRGLLIDSFAVSEVNEIRCLARERRAKLPDISEKKIRARSKKAESVFAPPFTLINFIRRDFAGCFHRLREKKILPKEAEEKMLREREKFYSSYCLLIKINFEESEVYSAQEGLSENEVTWWSKLERRIVMFNLY